VALPQRTSRALTFTLALLVAWPWNVMPSAVEWTQEAAPAARDALHRPGEHLVRRVGHPGTWEMSSFAVISQTNDEEEGDECGPTKILAGVGPHSGVHASIGIDFRPEPHPPTALPPPLARLCRLRC
jgi:hypothetical protein